MTTSIEELNLIKRIADRAAGLYERINGEAVPPQFIAAEIEFVHRNVCPLRLKEFADTDDGNFAHDIGGIHRHLNLSKKQFEDCFCPRFAQLN